MPEIAVWLAEALAGERQRTLIESLLDGPRPKQAVLLELGGATASKRGSNHCYTVLNRLVWQQIVRINGDQVELRAPVSVRAILDELDRYAMDLSTSSYSLSSARIERRRTGDSSQGLDQYRIGDHSIDPAARVPPHVAWIHRSDPDQLAGLLSHSAAHYDAERHELSISSSWRPYIALQHACCAFADHYGAMRYVVPGIVNQEWAHTLSEIVVARRAQAYEDGRQDHLGEYLSDDALTTAVIFQDPVRDRVRRRLREHARRRRQRVG